ncbi:unnamed protein product [Blepharisma stoltei]|uniref:Uncharacterized protein n=1 Tax=Blepharisma stoltei TaxID=1481888 RepID=A0AAU9JDD2_9CILI|nr:unnamed protein product [Blepharisma stoltei]
MNTFPKQKNSLPILTSKRIREIVESPTQISYSTKMTQHFVSQSLSSPLSARSPKSFLPFVSERDSNGKILPLKPELSLPCLTPTLRNPKRDPPSDPISPKSLNRPLQSIGEYESPRENNKKYQKTYRLASPRIVQLPAVGLYNVQSPFDKKDWGFFTPRADKYPEAARDASPSTEIDTITAYQFKDKHNPSPNLKKTTGRGKKFFAPPHHDMSDIYNTKLPDKFYMIHPAMAEIDVNGYMHEIWNLEKSIQEKFDDIKKSHKQLMMLY